MSEYPKIETLYERDKKTFVVNPGVFKNPIFEFTANCKWRWTEKVDGTNIRVIFTPATQESGDSFYQPTPASMEVRGRTDNASIPARLLQRIQQMLPAVKLAEKFQSPVIMYGEGYGAGIQKGGYYVPKDEQTFILFDVKVGEHNWLAHEDVIQVASALEIPVVPDFGLMTIPEATEFVRYGFRSIVAERAGNIADAEGLVGRTDAPLYDRHLSRLIVKLKTKDFLPGKAKAA